MTKHHVLLIVLIAALIAVAPACLYGDSSGSNDDDPDDDTGDDDADDDTGDDDADDDSDDDDDDDAGGLPYPKDGNAYVGVGCLSVNPTAETHPSPIYLAGFGTNRVAEAIHDDLDACVVAVGKDEEYAVMVSLDLVGLTPAIISDIEEHLAAEGVDRDRLVISCTHTHNAPDTIGLWGPSIGESGLDPVYRQYVIDRTAEAVMTVSSEMLPAVARMFGRYIDVPESNFAYAVRDSREPVVVPPDIRGVHFETPEGEAIGTLVNWVPHPEAAGAAVEVSSDFVGYVRSGVTAATGAPTAYFSGAVGGLMTPLGVVIPLLDEDGEPVLDEFGDPVLWTSNDFDHARSYGLMAARHVTEAMAVMGEQPIDTVVIDSVDLLFPVTNPYLVLAFLAGILEDIPGVVEGEPEVCGGDFCVPARVSAIRIGDIRIVTTPGESFPESIWGREASTVDWGGEWGTSEFPAMRGIVASLTGGVLMHLGLAHFEMGYLVPASDFVDEDHPDYYEESFCVGPGAEQRVHDALGDLLSSPPFAVE